MVKLYSLISVLFIFFLAISCSRFELEPYQGKVVIRNRQFQFNKLNFETCNVTYRSTLFLNNKLQENIISAIEELEKVLPIHFESVGDGASTIRFMELFSGVPSQIPSDNELFYRLKIPKNYDNYQSNWVDYKSEDDKLEIYLDAETIDELSDVACKRIIIQSLLEAIGFEIRNEETNSIFSSILNLTQKEVFTNEDIQIINRKYTSKCLNEESTPKFNISLESIAGQNGAYFNIDFSNLGGNTILDYGILINNNKAPEYQSDRVSFSCELYNKTTNTIRKISDNTFKYDTPLINSNNAKRAFLVSGIKPGQTYSVRSYAKNIYGVGYGPEIKFSIPTFPKTPKGEFREIGNLKITKNYVFQDGVLLDDDYYYWAKGSEQNSSFELSKINLKTRENITLSNTPIFNKSGSITICKVNSSIYLVNFNNEGLIEVIQYNTSNNNWNRNTYPNVFAAELSRCLKIEFIKNGDKLYIFGSKINEMSIYEYDFEKNNLKLLKTIFENSIGQSKPHIIENNVYFFYGIEVKEGPVYHRNNFWKLNMQNWTLNKLPIIPTNPATNGAEIGYFNNKIYVLPKSNTNISYWYNSQNQADKNEFWEYDLKTEKWSLVNQIIDTYLYKKNTSSFVHNNNLYFVFDNTLKNYLP